jgi:putative SOS response-associated peptidase YedK
MIVEPYPSQLMTAYPISTRVNNVKNDDAALIEPIAINGNHSRGA